MRTKLSLFALVSVLALLLSACGSAAAQPRTLAVSGNGTVYLAPDIAYIYVGVHNQDAVIATAVNNNNTQTQALVDALKAAGVAEVDIQTSNFSVYNTTSYDQITGQSNGTVYAVDNTVYVTVRDLSMIGKLLNTAVGAGANNINSITFDVADKSAALTEARQKAMANASSLASELAATAGVNLGPIQNVSYSDNSPTLYAYGKGGGGGASAAPNASVPIQPGLTEITVTVSVSYSLK
jgi:uncharacterized protein YggE